MQAQDLASYRTDLDAAFAKRGGPGETTHVTIKPRGETEQPTLIFRDKGHLLGDALIRVPAYRAARIAFPNHRLINLSAEKTAFTGPLAPIAHLFFDEIFSGVEANSEQRQLARSFGPMDIVLDLRSNMRSSLNGVTFFGSAKRFVANSPGFAARYGAPRSFEVRPRNNAARYHRMVEIVAGHRLPYDFRIPTLPQAKTHAAELLPDGERYFGITSGPLTQTKSWPREGHITVAARVRAHGFRPVVLLGAFEGEQRAWYEANIPDALIVDLATARGDAGYLLWLLHAVAGRFAGCVSNENGLQHLVASRGIPLLTLSGPTNSRAWKPVTPLWWCIRAQQFGSDEPRAIPPAFVADTVSQMIRWIERNEDNRANAPMNSGQN
ncbi:glycosyltransferase family 9 [Variibacter gotjawalensis]|uniref:Glycosyltransferase family 9 n=1 Tax=Variibacter gotjawalensis TaxID=1333996 RepID=A0A0S3PY44_9BRAD|nr:glycosyltransferase family 9 protein [Variibacter gotjawalensis]NIK46682.1 ADP-heptose:LPS heptosyltransferase [Variibacter gotjawalensis]RZS48585.1 ADP-heptose:LPS heptosyltransferase [Variibacter gotjawalensis]BAT60847.1 glycosyltransferase family 9 [Variibacter gotjawalensis]